MPQVICPFCLQSHDFGKPPRCEIMKEDVPQQYINDYTKAPPLWLVTAGFSQHGKTTYLAALTLMLKKLSVPMEDVFVEQLDEYTNRAIRQMQVDAMNAKAADPTDKSKPSRPLLLSIHDLPESGSRCLVMYDVAGERYETINNMERDVPAIKHCTTTWFLISLEDLRDDKTGKDITQLFMAYRRGMESLRIDLKRRNLIVIYTKADLNQDKRIRDYIMDDPFQTLTAPDVETAALANFSRSDYLDQMRAMSDYLYDYTRRKVDNGAAFIAMVKKSGMNLFFCVTSALGQSTGESRQMVESARRFRVLDPLFWALSNDMESDKRSLALIVDGVQKSSRTYGVAQKLWETLSGYGDVTTYALGQVTPVAVAGQPLPAAPSTRVRQHLIGPLLERLGSQSRVVVISDGKITDLGDFQQLPWRDRLLLVTLDEPTQQTWAQTIFYHDGTDPNTILDELQRLETEEAE